MKYRQSVYRHAASKLLIDLLLAVASLRLAFLLRFDQAIPQHYVVLFWQWLPFLVACRAISTVFVTRYRLQWRSTSLAEIAHIAKCVAFGSLLFLAILKAAHCTSFGLSLIAMEAFITLNLMVAARIATRILFGYIARRDTKHTEPAKRVLVVGAGAAGGRIVRQMNEDPSANLRPVGFVDDDPRKTNRVIHGVPVLGLIAQVEEIAKEQCVDQILIAIPTLPASGIREVIRKCSGARGELTILPTLPQIIATGLSTNSIRRVRVEDLLERAPVSQDGDSIGAYTSGQRILVTGAGGSIGAELCRQIARLNVDELILLGQGENSLFWIEQELRQEYGTRAPMVIADIKDRVRLEAVYREFRPTVVFHAAAHKHVPMMEANPGEAVKNNVFGTLNLAELAMQYGVHKFVMISTDKAVNPTSVMGTTKRVAEMIVQSLAQRIEEAGKGVTPSDDWGFQTVNPGRVTTVFSAVRFGNVLGSSGSVIPVMERQIARGGPVTVTHPEMTRYFMTIPEAVQLVIRAGGMGAGGEVFVLDMGKPVRIMDLAWNLIRLSGLVPNVDIKIDVTGTRPGEKLYEEVMTAEEGTRTTSHDLIRIARASQIDHAALGRGLDRLRKTSLEADPNAVREALFDLVPTYAWGAAPAATPPLTASRDLDIPAALRRGGLPQNARTAHNAAHQVSD